MPTFDRTRIAALLTSAGERLRGDWFLAGGAAAAAWFAPARTTEDIDIVAIDGGNAERLALFELAESLGLPVEVMSSTIDYFVRRIPDWRDHLVVLHRGRHATIYRPDATLYLQLKARRLTAVDLGDCIALLDHCAETEARVDRVVVIATIDALPPSEDGELARRRRELRGRVTGPG